MTFGLCLPDIDNLALAALMVLPLLTEFQDVGLGDVLGAVPLSTAGILSVCCPRYLYETCYEVDRDG